MHWMENRSQVWGTGRGGRGPGLWARRGGPPNSAETTGLPAYFSRYLLIRVVPDHTDKAHLTSSVLRIEVDPR